MILQCILSFQNGVSKWLTLFTNLCLSCNKTDHWLWGWQSWWQTSAVSPSLDTSNSPDRPQRLFALGDATQRGTASLCRIWCCPWGMCQWRWPGSASCACHHSSLSSTSPETQNTSYHVHISGLTKLTKAAHELLYMCILWLWRNYIIGFKHKNHLYCKYTYIYTHTQTN